MPNGIASDEGRVASGIAYRAVEGADNLGIGVAAVGEVPTTRGKASTHFKTPSPRNVERREVVFDDAIAPVGEPPDVVLNLLEDIGDGWVEGKAGLRV